MTELLAKSDVQPTAFWIADTQFTGDSAVLNRDVNGSSPHWFDHARDLLHMINLFRAQIKGPILGLAHSMGAAQLCHLALTHPALFHSLILVEPSIYANPSRTLPLVQAQQLAIRPERYPNIDVARQKLRRAFRRWDSRAFELHLQHGLYRPDDTSDEVATCTPRDAELALVARPNPEKIGYNNTATPPCDDHPPANPLPSAGERTLRLTRPQRLAHPDIDPASHWLFPYYSPSARIVYNQLPHLRPRVLWIDGGASHWLDPTGFCTKRVARCGTGVGGSGGVAEGQVAHVVLPGRSHAMVVEQGALSELGAAVAKRVIDDLDVWRAEDAARREERAAQSTTERQRFDPQLRRLFAAWDGVEFLEGREREVAIRKKAEAQRRRRERRDAAKL